MRTYLALACASALTVAAFQAPRVTLRVAETRTVDLTLPPGR